MDKTFPDYQEFIVEHSKRPHNSGKPAQYSHEAQGYNRICGDHIHVYVLLDDNRIKDLKFEADSCAICKASASAMSERLVNLKREEAQSLVSEFFNLVQSQNEDGQGQSTGLNGLHVFAFLKRFPSRIKCAQLPWTTLRAALADNKEIISTE